MLVTTTSLEMLTAPPHPPRPMPDGVRLDRAPDVPPEFARFLYGLVGGPWRWTDRLGWSRQQWLDELSVPGTEHWVAYGEGVPLGYVQLQPQRLMRAAIAVGEPGDECDAVAWQTEIRYFGLAESAIGRGLGGRMLEHAVAAAWTLPERAGLGGGQRVWVHTCTLDGPAALANYRARGFEVFDVTTAEEDVPAEPIGAWAATGGPDAR